MTPTTIKKLFRSSNEQVVHRLLSLSDEPTGILEVDGTRLYANNALDGRSDVERTALMQDDQVAGWVVGQAGSKWKTDLVLLLQHLLTQESAKAALASEVLDNYRELHLLYRLSEELALSLEPESIGRVALKEICPLIQASSGFVLLTDENLQGLQVIAQCQQEYQIRPGPFKPDGVLMQVIQTGISQLSNDQPADEYFLDSGDMPISMLCAPLKTEKRVWGAITLVREAARPFSAGDFKLLNAIAMQTASVIEIAHLHRVELEAARIERDLQMAQRVQSGLLPRKMPVLEGWTVAALWQPARTVSGDLYDFIHFPDGRLGLVVADVADKGIHAALVMANTRSILRGVAASAGRKGSISPGHILSRVNQVLREDMADGMFVTCLLAILDPHSGSVRFANAGHNLAYLRTGQEVSELHATGFPLGIFSNADYEEKETMLNRGDSLLIYSDGLVEAHNPQGEMFDYPRLSQLLKHAPDATSLEGVSLLQRLMAELAAFTGPNWEQEDDVTLLTVYRQ